MEQNIKEIMRKYNRGETDRETVNAALKEAGCGYHLEELTAEQRAEKAAREYREGYIPAAEPAKPVQRKVDMRRRPELAGQTAEQRTAAGRYRVEYDGEGYAVRADRVRGGGADE